MAFHELRLTLLEASTQLSLSVAPKLGCRRLLVRRLNVLAAMISTSLTSSDRRDSATQRQRKLCPRCRQVRLRPLIAIARAADCRGILFGRADLAFYSAAFVHQHRPTSGACFSIARAR